MQLLYTSVVHYGEEWTKLWKQHLWRCGGVAVGARD